MNEEEAMDELPWATMDRIRLDLKTRADQVRTAFARLRAIGAELERLQAEVLDAELKSSGGRRRRRRRGAARIDKGPTVVDIAVEILSEKGCPLPCTELARLVRARGVDSGNNERSLRMSASKGKRLRSLPDDVVALP